MLLLRYVRKQKPPQLQHAAVRVFIGSYALFNFALNQIKMSIFQLLADWG